jgi:hypothetical protein
MAPPISMHTVLVFQATKTIGVKAHCRDGCRRSSLVVACLERLGSAAQNIDIALILLTFF